MFREIRVWRKPWFWLVAMAFVVLRSPRSEAAPVIDRAAYAAPDRSRPPKWREPSVIETTSKRPGKAASTSGWTHAVLRPTFPDNRRRPPIATRPVPFGHTLRPGERFRFDVTFAGNPAGLAEAEIVGLGTIPSDELPSPGPVMRLEGHARTSGIVSLLATVTDDLVAFVDARTGASVQSTNTLNYQGWAPRRYKTRVTTQRYEGRGHIRIHDRRDDEHKHKIRRIPVDTFDPLAAMAWVRSLDLEEGEHAKAHTMDGTTLLRLNIESRGNRAPKVIPSIVTALGLGRDDIVMLEGELTRVDEFGQAIPGKRVYKLRAYLSDDTRRLPLVLESDLYVGAIRLELAGYDPPAQAGEHAHRNPPAAPSE